MDWSQVGEAAMALKNCKDCDEARENKVDLEEVENRKGMIEQRIYPTTSCLCEMC